MVTKNEAYLTSIPIIIYFAINTITDILTVLLTHDFSLDIIEKLEESTIAGFIATCIGVVLLYQLIKKRPSN